MQASAGVIVGVLSLVVSAGAAAQPNPEATLAGVSRVVVLSIDADAVPAAAECGLATETLIGSIVPVVAGGGLQALRQGDEPKLGLETRAVFLVPTLATVPTGRFACASWIGLEARSTQSLTLPFGDERRLVQILHWSGGTLVATPRSGHAAAVTAALGSLAGDFVARWRRDKG